MSATQDGGGERYEIIVGKRLGARSGTAFDSFVLSDMPDNGTLLRSGPIDQAALHGVLGRICDLGIPLVSVRIVTSEASSGEAE